MDTQNVQEVLIDKFWAMAPEGAGNHLLSRILGTHPELENKKDLYRVDSLPHGRVNGKGIWITSNEVVKYKPRKLILCTRSPRHACYSAFRRFAKCTEYIYSFIEYHDKALCFMGRLEGQYPSLKVSYEAMTDNLRAEQYRIAQFLELKETSWDIGEPVTNRNDNRWRKAHPFSELWSTQKVF